MSTQPKNAKLGRYDFPSIEARWQRYWEQHGTFRALNPDEAGTHAEKPKFYILDMFPYPSGAGLHVGHPLGYCATDIVSRCKRMQGFNVLHPMGFDAFGLPAEQYAIEHNVHPADTTFRNIAMYRRQLKMFGFSYDWSRELATCAPDFYKHTQWIFLQMFNSWYDERAEWTAPDGKQVVGRARLIAELEAELDSGRRDWRTLPLHAEFTGAGQTGRKIEPGQSQSWEQLGAAMKRLVIDAQRLAYSADAQVNWCPALGTVLSNEEVDSEGRSDRGGHPVYRRPLRQWMLRITKYAERLLTDLDGLDWPEPIKLMQRNWIGRSTGAEVLFPLAHKWRIESGLWVHAERPDLGSRDLNYQTFPDAIRVYTTRPDTLFGATYMVLAPEHELVDRITAPQQRKEVETYVEQARRRSELERTAETKAKTGVFTGAYAINPVNGWKIPVWVADYVLMGYGTGAIMAVPGGDTRDFEFACKFDLPIVCVVGPTVEWIEERLSVMVTGIEKTAAAGLDEVARQFPEWGAEVARRRERSAGLDQKTIGVLRGHVGVDRLIEHYIEHPKSWGDAFTGEGTAVHSPGGGKVAGLPGGVCALDGLPTAQAKAKIIAWLEANGLGRGAVNYKMRDWVFSRQKYWGEPFPILHGEGGETIPLDDELPVTLPEMEDFKPAPAGDDPDAMPAPPLSRATDWVNVARSKDRYRRDVNTMPQWAGSCWYYLRFIDPHNPDLFCNPDAERYWMPVDLYVGGAEHAVLHLLYARFWHKVLYDLGHVSTSEPFRRLFNQGMIQGFAYRDRRGLTVYADDVEAREGETFVRRGTDEPVARVIAKMSKSLKNVVNPDEIIGQYGADTFRLYEMFMGPLDASKPWNTRDVPGLFKLCQRVWRLIVDEETNELSATLTRDEPDDETLRMLHKTIQRVTEDIEQLKFNTAIAAIFDFVNFLTPKPKRPRAVIEPFVLIVSPFAPHLGEELWHRLGHEATLAYEPWPVFDERLARDEEVEIAVQITGKVKARIMVPADADARAVEAAALANDRVQGLISGKQIRKVIVVPKRLVNIITN